MLPHREHLNAEETETKYQNLGTRPERALKVRGWLRYGWWKTEECVRATVPDVFISVTPQRRLATKLLRPQSESPLILCARK